jgi:hypothetical protein
MTENISPEEKLFKIIREEKKPSDPGAAPAQKKDPPAFWNKALQDIKLWQEKITAAVKDLIRKKRLIPGKPYEIPLKTVNNTLMAALLLTLLFVVYYAIVKYPTAAKIMKATVRMQGTMPLVFEDPERLQSVSYYTDEAKKRDIFKISSGSGGEDEGPALTGEKDAAEGLKLQGIAWSDVPKVILQDERDKKMYVLKEGQSVGVGGVKVKKILKNKVMLNDGEKDFEL